jgi:phage terminase large subunit
MLNVQALGSFIDGMTPPERRAAKEVVSFRPQPKQEELLAACGLLTYFNGGLPVEPKAPVIGYGGAAFGGKSYGMLGLADIAAQAFPGIQMAYYRRTYAELDGPGAAMFKAHEIFGAHAKRREAGKHWQFANGSDFYFRHCENEGDVFRYQSQDMDIVFIDEATHFSWFMVDYLLTRNRVSGDNGIIKPFAVLSSNPGNIGHTWYMQLFDLDEMPFKMLNGHYDEVLATVNPNGKISKSWFIPAFMDDNFIGLERDPEYPDRLDERDPDVAAALKLGDWSVFSGQAFRDFDKKIHTCKPFELPEKWPKWRAVDWGWDHPFVCLWLTRDPNIGRVYVYREHVQSGLTDVEQADMIVMSTPEDEYISITFADPSMWAKKNVGGMVKSTADEYYEGGVPLMKADNNRIGGKRKIHAALKLLPDGKPGLQIFDTCKHLIDIIPKMIRSDRNSEDCAKMDGDDPYDTLRYGLTNVSMFGKRRSKNGTPKPNPWEGLRGIT